MSQALVIGLGNPLMGDDGVGLAALSLLRDEWRLEGVDLLDGGTWGLSLLPSIEDAERLLVLDAIAAGGKPGDVMVLERDRLPIYLNRKLSPHQIDLKDTLAVAELRGRLPQETVAIGIEPESVELEMRLSDSVQRSLAPMVAAAIARLSQWGFSCERRDAAAPA